MREMDRKEFALPPSARTMLALSVAGSAACGVFMAVAATTKTQLNAPGALRVVFAIVAVLLMVWSARDFRKLFVNPPALIFTQEFVEDTFFGLGRIPWTHVISIQPYFEDRRGMQFKTLFLEVSKPWTYLNSMPFYNKSFLPLRTWRTQLLPLYFGAFNNRFEEAIEWIESYKPEIPVRWPE